jgi:L-2-hydroxyglutarate oxidase LhgO
MDKVDCIIIGAGVIGLAIAKEMAKQGFETIILERENSFGTITSSRNSEVIHAGIYYPTNSLKSQLCVKGNNLLYKYCEENHISTKKCGKLIVATHINQLPELERIYSQAQANGVKDLSIISSKEANYLEPNLNCVSAIHSTSTGIIDSHSYMLSLLGHFENYGGHIVYKSPFKSAQFIDNNKFDVHIGGNSNVRIQTKYLINCAGLSAPKVAKLIYGMPRNKIPKIYFAKGNYFSLTGKSPFSRLIYPIPEPGGLGIHLTIDMDGASKFGPDVEWLNIESEEEINYQVDKNRSNMFYSSIQQYWPNIKEGSLEPNYSGVRSKINPNGPADFIFQSESEHGLKGLINLYGFESPGLTSSLAISQHVSNLIKS